MKTARKRIIAKFHKLQADYWANPNAKNWKRLKEYAFYALQFDIYLPQLKKSVDR